MNGFYFAAPKCRTILLYFRKVSTIVNLMITYEYILNPTKAQKSLLVKNLRLTRDIYNQGLQELIDHYRSTGKHLNYFSHDKQHGKTQHPDMPSWFVDTTLRRLHRSFANFFAGIKEGRKVGFPRFKSANRWHTLQFRDAVANNIDSCYFKAGKMLGGRIRFVKHREIEGKLKFCRIVKRPSGWYLQAVCEDEPQPLPANDNAIGLDFGITHLIADSEGNKVANPQHLKRSLRRLAKAQRRLSRRKKGSNRRRKAAKMVARIHEKIANQRKDYLHKAARHYVNAYGTIVIEDLRPSNMVKNSHLARAISDSSWGMLRQFMEDKAEKAGRLVIAVPPQYTSQKCSSCGEIVQKALSVRTHVCPHCGYVDCRDTNAAKNIKRAGIRPSWRDVA